VIQYLYRKYGRERTALAATVICYRAKSAVRDVAKALGLPADQVDQLARVFAWWDGEEPLDERLRERGFDPVERGAAPRAGGDARIARRAAATCRSTPAAS
jgi:error-prone DNA polymerase